MKDWSRSVLTCLLGSALSLAAAPEIRQTSITWEEARARQRADRVTFNRDIAPIIFHNCAPCHRPGEAGPFPLLTYNDVAMRARQIVAVTGRRFMPPWLPETGEFKFAGELRLTDDQIGLFRKWFEQGAAEGDPADLPALPKFVPGWQLGRPDLVLRAQKPLMLPPGGADRYWNFIFRNPVDRIRWVRAVEIRPGNKRIVHHANILVDRAQSARRQERQPGAGFEGMELKIESEAFDPDSHFLFWKPGSVPYAEPEGMALRLDPGTDLVLNTHLQPSGKPELIQPSIGLYFTDKPATRFPLLLQLENDRKIDIPPGAKDFPVTDEFTLPTDVALLAIYPHAHYLGRDILAQATLPDGTSKTLIHIPRWDLNWQAVYFYAEPVPLPRGTLIAMHYTYDNSEANLANPNHPPQRVIVGNRSSDEMAHLWLQVLPLNLPGNQADPRMLLQEAMARHNLGKNPADFEANYNLAAMLQARGELAEAVSRYDQALRLRPDDPTAHNALGGALLAAGKLEEAISHFAAALRARPDYFDAHYNLGNALASQGDFKGAIAQFSAAVRVNPKDAGAEANLGGAFAADGKLSAAKSHLERALQLKPDHALARENLLEVQRQLAAQPK